MYTENKNISPVLLQYRTRKLYYSKEVHYVCGKILEITSHISSCGVLRHPIIFCIIENSTDYT